MGILPVQMLSCISAGPVSSVLSPCSWRWEARSHPELQRCLLAASKHWSYKWDWNSLWKCPDAFSTDVKTQSCCLLYRLMSFLLAPVAPMCGRICKTWLPLSLSFVFKNICWLLLTDPIVRVYPRILHVWHPAVLLAHAVISFDCPQHVKRCWDIA